MEWVGRDAEINVTARGDAVSGATLEGPVHTSWDPAVNVANGFDDVVILRVGQRGSVALDADDYTRAERGSDGTVRMYLAEIEVAVGPLVMLEEQP